MPDMKTYAYGPASGGNPDKIILMLHGVGSNGQDLIALAPSLAQSLPGAIFISPDAPQPYDMAPFGRQWFSLQSYEPGFMLDGARAAMPELNIYIDGLLTRFGLKDRDLALLGFSQGTMMSLYAGPRRAGRIAGILGYSGALLGAEDLVDSAIHKPPVCLIHGEADEVVPVSLYDAAKADLQQAGFAVDGMTIPGLPHSIDERGIDHGAAFLQKILYGP